MVLQFLCVLSLENEDSGSQYFIALHEPHENANSVSLSWVSSMWDPDLSLPKSPSHKSIPYHGSKKNLTSLTLLSQNMK